MESNKLNKFEQDPSPPIDGAYIRKLVKQLQTTNSSSKPNDTTTGCVGVVDNSTVSQSSRNNLRKHSKVLGSQLSHQQQQQHKKQVRRRLHTTRPYQEKILNMAEARREIVTALKFHRANMKQATEKQQQQQQIQGQNQKKQDEQNTRFFEQDGKFDSRRNYRSLPPLPSSSSSCMNNFPSNNNMIDEFSYSPFFSYISLPSVQNSFQNFPVFASTSSYSSPIDPPLLPENPNFTSLPNHSFGLNSNFNFHNFNNLDATLFLNNNNNNKINSSLFCYSSTTSSSNYSPPLSVVTDQKVPSIIGTTTSLLHGEGVSSSSMVDNNNNNNNTIESMTTTHDVGGDGSLHMHTAMDDEGIKEIESLCEQYQMEWNDTMNFITSTWWFNFLNIENGAPEVNTSQSDAPHQVFDEVVEFPSRLNNNANESCLEQCSEDYFKDPTLPCMDIGDIEFEGMDEEWLS